MFKLADTAVQLTVIATPVANDKDNSMIDVGKQTEQAADWRQQASIMKDKP